MSRFVFAAGGTGGHIYPAIAVADEIKRLDSAADIRFIGSRGKLEEKIMNACGYRLYKINVKGFKRRLSIKNITAGLNLFGSIRDSKRILSEFKPDVVFGTGGYVSGPVLWASCRMKIPAIVQEGNYYPGLTVRMLSGKVDRVILNFEGSRKYLKRQDNISVMQYPVRTSLLRYPKEEAREALGLDKNKTTLFILGGSQGAGSLNAALLGNYGSITSKGIQMIWQTGARDFRQVSEEAGNTAGIRIFEFLHDMDRAYSSSDLVVSRAGISAVMELAYFGLPAVFVPYPLAAGDHQQKNAKALADAGAAEIIADSEVEKELVDTVLRLIGDKNRLSGMSTEMRKFSDSKAAEKIAGLLLETSERKI